MTQTAQVPRGDSRSRRAAGLVAAAVVTVTSLSACSSDTTGVDLPNTSRISFTTRGQAASTASLSVVPVTKDGHTLDVTDITVVVARASLKRDKSATCMADDDEDDGRQMNFSRGPGMCGEVKLGPAIVDLPVDGKVVTFPGDAVPNGTFRELDVRISLVRLQGTFDGKQFDVTIPVNAKSEIEFDTPVVVTDSTPPSVTVNLPVDTWLVASDGSLIDPTKLSTSSSLMFAVRNKIAASIHAFEDGDCDGREDHDHRRGRG
ncbi:MAG TPA: hypothetical protein VIP11_13045 [Gemmatimonadaceae bacterium]